VTDKRKEKQVITSHYALLLSARTLTMEAEGYRIYFIIIMGTRHKNGTSLQVHAFAY